MADKVHHVRYRDGNRAFRAAFDAAFPGLPADMDEAERRITAALIAYDGVRFDEAVKFERKQRFTRFSAELAGGFQALGAAAQRAGEALAAATSKEAR